MRFIFDLGRRLASLAMLCLILAPSQLADGQVMDGRLVVTVVDPNGGAVPARVEIFGRSPELTATADTGADGRATLHRLPPGLYELLVLHPDFEEHSQTVEIRSAVPKAVEVRLNLKPVAAEVTVHSTPPLFNPRGPSRPVRVGSESLQQTLGTTLGRSTVDVVTTMPGWLLEANAVLHPRGSEYDTQYVIDGMPVYDNRSLAFAPAFENTEFEAVNVFTGGIPAEYGRRLGGVIALDTRRSQAPGHHSAVDLQLGSFGTRMGAASHQYAADGTVVAIGIQGGMTDRYLDPPSLENFTNKGSSSGFNARLEQDVSDQDRLTLYFRTNRTNFLVPNDLAQQAAGQRQDRRSSETAGQVHYQRTFSPRTLGSVRGMIRDLTSELWSNELSTPVYVEQDRGFREGAVIGDVTVQGEHHTFKVGGDLRVNNIRERFALAEPDELPELDLDFRDKQRSTEVGLYVQNQIRVGNFAANVGLRFDHYKLLIDDSALSPRVALSYYVPEADPDVLRFLRPRLPAAAVGKLAAFQRSRETRDRCRRRRHPSAGQPCQLL